MRIQLPAALMLLAAIGPAQAQQPAAPVLPPLSTVPGSPASSGGGAAAGERSSPSEKKPRKPVSPAAYLEEVVGTVVQVDRQRHRIVIQRTAGGEVTLEMDRNTLVYGPHGLATVLDVSPGAEVRAGRNTHDVAYWVAVRPAPPPREAVPTLGQGSSATTGVGPPPSERPGVPGAPPPGPAPGQTTAPGPVPNTPTKP